MTTVSIEISENPSIPSENLYAVELIAINSTGIELEVFVFDVEYDKFVSVATPYDMRAWPVSKAPAAAAGLNFYRARGVLRTFPNVEDATAFQTGSRQRITMLVNAWQTVVDSFSTPDTYTVPPPTESDV